jgi:hypothetical protein
MYELTAAAALNGTEFLDWTIAAGIILVLGGASVFRIVARWRGWMSDD